VKTDRPGLAEAIRYVRDGDTLTVWKLDRLGRLRIPMKPAIDSETKPATHSDFIPASIPI
jgi:DNA invertase Pin-like site-specific DNA recombinase